ncbi:hypothetical protein EVAR_29129_1 [Eumeta japonica]|uniref:Uncharacterized protein n=1 Tax=Eumeta variegata TaxID=151549 RepID=A0A4C1VCH3_EUMVA|nr:hypothetical protein EVAR_29129_1 [Eumeta japonica]
MQLLVKDTSCPKGTGWSQAVNSDKNLASNPLTYKFLKSILVKALGEQGYKCPNSILNKLVDQATPSSSSVSSKNSSPGASRASSRAQSPASSSSSASSKRQASSLSDNGTSSLNNTIVGSDNDSKATFTLVKDKKRVKKPKQLASGTMILKLIRTLNSKILWKISQKYAASPTSGLRLHIREGKKNHKISSETDSCPPQIYEGENNPRGSKRNRARGPLAAHMVHLPLTKFRQRLFLSLRLVNNMLEFKTCTKEYGIDLVLKPNRAKSCTMAGYVQLQTDRTDIPIGASVLSEERQHTKMFEFSAISQRTMQELRSLEKKLQVLLRTGSPAGVCPKPTIKVTEWKRVSTVLEEVDTPALNNIPDIIETTDEINSAIGALTNHIRTVVE